MHRTPAVRLTLAALSLGAASVHFAMTPQHTDESVALGVAFIVAAWAQVAVAGWLLLRPTRAALSWGMGVQAAVVGAWGLSRTTGLPFGPDRWQAEPIGTADLICVGFELAFVALAMYARTSRRRVPLLAGLVTASLVMGGTTVALASPSVITHHEHEDAGEHTAMHSPAHMTSPAHTASSPHTASPTHSEHHGATSTEPPTAAQIKRANDLIEATKASLAKWADPQAAEAAGFRSIQSPGATFVHFVNVGWMLDDDVLDPEHPESLVYRSTDGTEAGYRLESAMYILPRVGYPIPDVGGSLTPWHKHGDLCFRAGDGMIVGTTRAGDCPTGSKNFETPDMLHVWIVDHADGPFGGVEAP